MAQRRGRWVRRDIARVSLFLDQLPPDLSTVESVTTREIARFLLWGQMEKRWGPVTVLHYRDHPSGNPDDLQSSVDRPALVVRPKDTWCPKTGRPRRVPVSSKLMNVLLRQPRRSEWLFPSPTGLRWCEDNATHRLRAILDRQEPKMPWTFADFRRTFASYLAVRGVGAFKIARLMGTSVQMIESHYGCLMPEELRREVEF